MTASQVIAQHLPYLRRYARALAGSQQAGDAYVVVTLEALVEDASSVRDSKSPRVALYRAFSRIWNSVQLNHQTEAVDAALPPQKRLAAITPLPRQAFLLVALEEFGDAEAARILDIDVATLQSLVDEAGREIASEIATDVLIIEDEPLIALDLQELIEGLGHRTVGVASTHAQAVAIAKSTLPGLILADVRLADGSSGIDAVDELLRSMNVPVIFITAFPKQLLTGSRPEPTFLITKPFQRATVSAVISQALFFQPPKNMVELMARRAAAPDTAHATPQSI